MTAAQPVSVFQREYGTYDRLPRALRDDDRYTTRQKLLISTLLNLQHLDDGLCCWPSYAWLARRLDCSPTHVPRLIRQVNDIERRSRIIRDFNAGPHRTNRYTVYPPAQAHDSRVMRLAATRAVPRQLARTPRPVEPTLFDPPPPRATPRPTPATPQPVLWLATPGPVDVPIEWADVRRPPEAAPPATIFTPPRFNLAAACAGGRDPVARLKQAVLDREVTAVQVRGVRRLIAAVKESGGHVYVHLAVHDRHHPRATQPLVLPLAQIFTLELYP